MLGSTLGSSSAFESTFPFANAAKLFDQHIQQHQQQLAAASQQPPGPSAGQRQPGWNYDKVSQ